MNIALLTYSTKPRGSVIHTLELADALTDLGHSVCIYVLAKGGQGFDRPTRCQVKLIPAQPAPSEIAALIHQRIQEFATYLHAELQAEQNHYDIYHAQDCLGANALLQLRQQGLIPHFVRTIHHVDQFENPYLQDCQTRSLYEPDLRLCVSQHWQAILQDQYQIDAPLVLNGVNLDRFSPKTIAQDLSIKERYGLRGTPVYLTVGGIEPRKNSIRLLRAFARILQENPKAQLVIAGGATLFDYQTYRDEFFAVAQQLDIQPGKSLILPGVIPDADLPSLFRGADLFCFPSLTEGWGLVLLEAIASGLPIITSEQPPFTEFLAPDQACWVEPSSVESIYAAMSVMQDPQQQRSLIQKSQSVVQHYSWKRTAQQHLELYQRCLSHLASGNTNQG